jgi:hypothetical protein
MNTEISADMTTLPGNCRVLLFPELVDSRGTLSVVEAGLQVPFPIRRIFYVYGVPRGARRGGHAHRRLQEVLVALNGTIDVLLDDGNRRVRWHLEDPSKGLYIAPMVWAEQEAFSEGAVGLVLASEVYDRADYLCDYGTFQTQRGAPERTNSDPSSL